jgi:hypothetical protein
LPLKAIAKYTYADDCTIFDAIMALSKAVDMETGTLASSVAYLNMDEWAVHYWTAGNAFKDAPSIYHAMNRWLDFLSSGNDVFWSAGGYMVTETSG